MGKLNAGNCSLFADEAGDGEERLSVAVSPDAAVVGADPPLGADRGRFDHDQPGATDGAASEVNEMPVGRHSVPARILTHGGYEDAVSEGDPAQGQGGEKSAHALLLSFWKSLTGEGAK
jgi:hypothetical protein